MISTILLDLTFRQVVGEIPHDAGAVVAYLLLGLFGAFIWIGSRRPEKPTETGGVERSPSAARVEKGGIEGAAAKERKSG